MPLKIGGILFPLWELLDLMGPLGVLLKAAELCADPDLSDSTFALVGATTDAYESASHFPTIPKYDYASAPQFDVLLVPGGMGTRASWSDAALVDFIRRQAEGARVVVSVCTGSCLLANAGLLEGRRATSNKKAFGLMSQFGKNVEYIWEARFVEDGKVWTGSGVSAGVDLGFALARKLYGADAADAVSKEWGYEPLSEHDDPFAKIHPFMDSAIAKAEYQNVLANGQTIVDNLLRSLNAKDGKRRIATVLQPGFDLAEFGFIAEAFLAVKGSHWFDLVRLTEDTEVNGGSGGKYPDVVKVQTDRRWTKENRLVDKRTDLVFIPSGVADVSLLRPLLEELVHTSGVRVLLCGDSAAQQAAGLLNVDVKYNGTGWMQHDRWFFARNLFGSVRACLQALIELSGVDTVRAGVINMELSPKLLPPEVSL